MGFGDFKDLPRRAFSDKVLPDKTFDIAKNKKYDGHKCGLVSMVYKLFNKKSSGGTVARTDKSTIKSKILTKQQLAGELHKLIIGKFEKRKV